MEFIPRRSTRKLNVPERPNTAPRPQLSSKPADSVWIPNDLATERSRHGFDDVVDDEIVKNIGLRTLLFAWVRQALRRDKNGSRARNFQSFVKDKSASVKNDIKWVVASDLDTLPAEKPVRSAPILPSLPVVNPPKAHVHKTIDININLPKLPRSAFLTALRSKRPRGKQLILYVVTLFIVGAGSFYLLNKPPSRALVATGSLTADDSRTGQLTKGTPDYKTILPAGTSIEDYGGWTRVSPPDRNPVFAYTDKIGNIPVNISQQPLPKEFADQPTEQLKVLANGYHADKTIKAGTTTVFVGTSAKGPQSIIFTKNKLLILIKASAQVNEDQLIDYINSLR